MKLTILLVLLLAVSGEVIKAYSAQDVNDLLTRNKGKVIGLFFINPHMNDSKLENKSFWQSILGVMDSLKGLLTSEEVHTEEIEQLVGEKAILVEIDVSDPKLQYVVEEVYDVSTVPYLILLKGDVVLFKGIPTNDSY